MAQYIRQNIKASILLLIGVVGMIAPSSAYAENIVAVTPLIAKGVNLQSTANISALISSEVDFVPSIDSTREVDAAPSKSCMTSTSCLKNVANAAGANKVITGTLSPKGDGYTLEILLYDNDTRKIVRKNTHVLPGDPSSIADGMTAIVQELINGTTAEEEEGALPTANDFAMAEDDFSFEPEPVGGPIIGAAATSIGLDDLPEVLDPAEEARKAETQRLAQEQARLLAQQQAAAEQARLAAQAEATRLAAEAAVAAARAAEAARLAALPIPGLPMPALAADEDFDLSMISFGSSSTPAPTPDYGTIADLEEEEGDGLLDLDDANNNSRRSKIRQAVSKATVTKVRTKSESSLSPKLSLRGGYSVYASDRYEDSQLNDLYTEGRVDDTTFTDNFGFITFGAEFAYPVHDNIVVIGGMELYSINRKVPLEQQPVVMKISEWNTLFPLNAGALYVFDLGNISPYAGADILLCKYYESSWATGLRLRGGVDIVATDRFGFNINVAYGALKGSHWVEVASINEDIGNSGTLPQFSAGTFVTF